VLPEAVVADVGDPGAARAEIANLLAKYAVCVDRRDFEGLRDCFIAGAQAEYSGVRLDPGTDAILAHIRPIGAFPASQHIFGSPSIEINGDRATAFSYAVAYLVRAESAGGHVLVSRGLSYSDELVRRPQGWRIAIRIHAVHWSTEQPTIWPVPAVG
jgi:hypothetical protein